jgi:hypothetical protein
METKTRIILRRPNEWLNRGRSYKVLLDGAEVGSIRSGATEEFTITEGKHQLQCKMSWYSSAELLVELRQGQVEYLIVRSGMKYYWPLFFLLLVGISINLFYLGQPGTKPIWASLIQLMMILPALLYMLFYLSVGRKQYIVVEEDKDNVFAG